MDVLRAIALRALGVADHGNDIRLLGDAVIALSERIDDLQARLAEFDLAGAEAGGEA